MTKMNRSSDLHPFYKREGVEDFWERMSADHQIYGDLTFPGFLFRTAQRLPEKIALIYGDRSYSYADLFRSVAGVSEHLKGVSKIERGSRVAILLENSDRYIIWYLAILAIGAIAVPLNSKLTAREIDFMLEDSSVALLVSESRFENTLAQLSSSSRTTFAILRLDNSIVPVPGRWDFSQGDVAVAAEAAIYYTSGTTGKPKGVVHTHQSLIAGTLQGPPAWEYDEEDVVNLASTPLFHIANHTVFMPTFYKGGTLVVTTFKAEQMFALIEKFKVTNLFAVPSMLLLMLQAVNRHDHDLSSVTTVAFGAAPMPVHKLEAIQQMFPNAGLVHGMGQTECCGTTVTLPSTLAFQKAGSVGVNIPGTEIKIVDEIGAELLAGEIGELITRGPNVMAKYLGREDATLQTLRAGWLHTGDLGFRDTEGYLFLVDRKKDMIIRGGENIYSSEVEQILYLMPEIAFAAVLGTPSEIFGEEVLAVLVKREGARELTFEEVQSHCAAHLAKFKVPASLCYIDSMPQTATGKIQKGEIRAMLLSDKFGKSENV